MNPKLKHIAILGIFTTLGAMPAFATHGGSHQGNSQ